MKKWILLLSLLSVTAMAKPYFCDGSRYFGLKQYMVSFSKLSTSETVSMQVVHGSKDLVYEAIHFNKNYDNSKVLDFSGVGKRGAVLSGYLDLEKRDGFILFKDIEIDLKNCAF